MLVLANLIVREFLLSNSLCKDVLNLCVGVRLIVELLDTVVRKAASHLMEEVVTLLQSIHHVSESADFHTCHLCQCVNIVRILRFLDVHCLVWTPCRNHACILLAHCLGILNMVVQVVNRVVGCANCLYIITAHKTASGIFWLLKFLIALIKDLAGCLWRELFCDAEGCFQLKVCPMIQRIAEGIWHSLSPFLEFLPIRCVCTGAVFFIYAVCSHCTPLVMVASKPQLSNALELVVLSNHFRNKVTMIIDDRHFSRMIVEKILCSSSF